MSSSKPPIRPPPSAGPAHAQLRILGPKGTPVTPVLDGQRAELTFYAVDEGVLMLTGYQLPDPVPVFTAPRPLQVANLESRADLGRLIDPVLGANEGAAGGGGGMERSAFEESAYLGKAELGELERISGLKSQLRLDGLAANLGPTMNPLPAGSLVVVDLLVTTGVERSQVVIDDPLAAGLEAIDSNLETSTRIPSGAAGRAPLATGFRTTWYRDELRDDPALFFADQMLPGMYHFRYFARATSLGDFVVPPTPTRVFEMYQPENYGRTGATKLSVVAVAAE